MEIALALSKSDGNSLVTGHRLPDINEARLNDLVPTLERFDLGIPEDHSSTQKQERDSLRQLWEPSTDPTYMLLPSRMASRAIIVYSLQILGWIHCAVRADVFLQEHEEFWNGLELGNTIDPEKRPWLSLYFSLLAVGLMYMEPKSVPDSSSLPHTTISGDTSDVTRTISISRSWYEAAFRGIENAISRGVASLPLIQSLVVLTLCNSNFGEQQREWLLSGVAINMARCLKMDKLGDEDEWVPKSHRTPCWSTAANREMGRRLWWTLVVCDWYVPALLII